MKTPQDTPLNILIIEDNPADFRLLVRHLQQQGLAVNCHRVATAEELKAFVEKDCWSVVLSDYNVPGMEFQETLSFVRERCPDSPFILVSGSVGEEKAVDLLKQGVGDFVLKDNLARLVPAVQRELREVETRRQRQCAEKALRESQEAFRLVTETINDVFWMSTPSIERMIYVSPAYEKLWGQSCASLYAAPRSFLNKVHPDDRKMVDENLARFHLPGLPYSVEYRITGADGSLRWILERGYPIFDEAGAVQLMAGICSDITESKRAELELTRLAMAVKQAAEEIVITDVNGTMLYVNPSFENITGYAFSEVVGQNSRILKSDKHDGAFYRHMWETLARGEVWRGRLTNKRKDGTLYEEDASISPVRDAAGKIVNYVAVKRDITREVAMEAQLRQSQKMEAIGTLAGGVAHEINNPINGIMNYTQLITDQLPADSPLQKFLANIMKETNRVSQIVRNLLSFARQNPQGPSPAHLNDIIKSVLTLVQSLIRHDQITLTVEVPDGLPQTECRSQQIEQVLLNLLTNARDALNEKYPAYHEDKIIRVTAHLVEQGGTRWIRTTVEDHANGIPPGIRDRVLDPFFTTKPAGKGTGLGLSISHGIVKEHNGELHFDTEAGRYTRFHVDLPLND